MKRALIAVLLGGLCSISAMASTFVAGMENSIPGNPTTVEGIGDYNDLIVSLQATGLGLVSATGSWSAFNSGIVNESQTYPTTNANPFWDNQSLDGAHQNIGYCLTTNNCGLGGSAGSPVDGVTQYLHGAGGIGSTDDGFYFTFSGQVTTVNLGAISLSTPNESLGWYDITNPGSGGVIIPLGSAGTPGNYDFTPTATSFGLWFYVNGNYYYSQTVIGGGGAPASRYAVFSLPESGVPEPGTMALFGLGALALGLIPRLRKRR